MWDLSQLNHGNRSNSNICHLKSAKLIYKSIAEVHWTIWICWLHSSHSNCFSEEKLNSIWIQVGTIRSNIRHSNFSVVWIWIYSHLMMTDFIMKKYDIGRWIGNSSWELVLFLLPVSYSAMTVLTFPITWASVAVHIIGGYSIVGIVYLNHWVF